MNDDAEAEELLRENDGERFELDMIDARRFSTLGDVRDYLRGYEAQAFEMLIDHALERPRDCGLSVREAASLRSLCGCVARDLFTLGRIAARPAPSSYRVRIGNTSMALDPKDRPEFLTLALLLGAAVELPHVLIATLVHRLRAELARPLGETATNHGGRLVR